MHSKRILLLACPACVFVGTWLFFLYYHNTRPACILHDTEDKIEKIREYYEQLHVVREGRWNITYRDDAGVMINVSKLMLGLASISLNELIDEWPGWSTDERFEFCLALPDANIDNLPEYLRFIMKNGSDLEWKTLALPIAVALPRDESVLFLADRIRSSQLGEGGNYLQALSISGDSQAIAIIKDRLFILIQHPKFSEAPELVGENIFADEALRCVDFLFELGVSPESMHTSIHALQTHISPSIRSSIAEIIARHGPVRVRPRK